jgi:prevent-host-death family protein
VVGSNPFRDRLGYWMDRVAAGEDVIITRHGKPRIRLSQANTTIRSRGERRAAKPVPSTLKPLTAPRTPGTARR